MKQSRFSEEQIIGLLQEPEAGAPGTEICRRHSMSSATFCAWKAKHGGMDVSAEPTPKIAGDRQRHPRPRAAIRRRLRARPSYTTTGDTAAMPDQPADLAFIDVTRPFEFR